MDISGGGRNGKKATVKSGGKKTPEDENPSQKRGNNKKEQSKKEKRGKGGNNENDQKKEGKKRKIEDEVEEDEDINKDFEDYLVQKEHDPSSKIDQANLLKQMKIDQKKQRALKVQMEKLMKENIEESGKEEKTTKEDVASTKDVESFVAADIRPEEQDPFQDDVLIEDEQPYEEQEDEEQEEDEQPYEEQEDEEQEEEEPDNKEEEEEEEKKEEEEREGAKEEPEMKEHEKEDNTHKADNIALVEGTENTKVKKSVTFEDNRVAYIHKGVEQNANRVSNKDKIDEEKGNNIKKTSGEEVPDESSVRKDRKEPYKDETKKKDGNSTQKTDDKQVEEESAQFPANTEAGISNPIVYTTENISELEVNIPEKEHDAGVPDAGVVEVNPCVVVKEGRHTIRKKKISPKRVVQQKQDDKDVRSGKKDPEYIPPVEPLPSMSRRESKQIKDRIAEETQERQEEDEDDIPLARLKILEQENKISDEKLSKEHKLKSCSVSLEKMRVPTKAERKEMPTSGNWFQHLQTTYEKNSQLQDCEFDDDEEDMAIFTDCAFCGHRSGTVVEHLEHTKQHSEFFCNKCLAPFYDQEDYDNHMDEMHGINVTDNTGGLAQNLIRGTDNNVVGALVQVGDTTNEEVSQYCFAVVVEDSPPKKSPVKEWSIEVKSKPCIASDNKCTEDMESTQPSLSNEEHQQAIMREVELLQEYTKEYVRVPLNEISSSEDTEKAETCDSETDTRISATT